MVGSDWPQIGLWSAVVVSGLYHGVNPAMGWPLAVSNGLMERRTGAVFKALGCLSTGHILAILVVIAPFALLALLAEWQWTIRIGASALTICFGALLLTRRRHPRLLARIPPSRLVLWSFVIAIAHGAALMLLPMYFGVCQSFDVQRGHRAAAALMRANLGMAVVVSTVHAVAMLCAGGMLAWLVYRHLGLKFVARSWFNLDMLWASSLMLVGILSLAINTMG